MGFLPQVHRQLAFLLNANPKFNRAAEYSKCEKHTQNILLCWWVERSLQATFAQLRTTGATPTPPPETQRFNKLQSLICFRLSFLQQKSSCPSAKDPIPGLHLAGNMPPVNMLIFHSALALWVSLPWLAAGWALSCFGRKAFTVGRPGKLRLEPAGGILWGLSCCSSLNFESQILH